MKMVKGGDIFLPAYFEDSNNDPVTGAVANVKFHWRSIDDNYGGTDLAATAELGGGWYNYVLTDTSGVSFVYWATLTSYKNFPGGVVEVDNINTSAGTFTHTSGTSESSALFSYNPLATGKYAYIRGVFLDMTACTQDTIIRIKQRIRSNVRTVDSVYWNSSMDAGVVMGEMFTYDWVQITLQSLTAEGASRSVPYVIHYEELP